MFEQGFDAAKVASATREELQGLAFPDAAPRAEAPKAAAGSRPGSTAATMFDLVAERAERKRRSAPVIGEAASGEVAAAENRSAAGHGPLEAPAGGALVPPAPVRSPALPIPSVSTSTSTSTSTSQSPPASAPAAEVDLEARADEAPLRWKPLLVCAAIGAALMMADLHYINAVWAWRLTVWISDKLGAWDVHTDPVMIYGRTYPGMPSKAVHFFADELVGVIGLLDVVLLLLILPIYRRWAMGRPRGGRDGVLCGWCGYSMPATFSGRCPECGHAPWARGQGSERPPTRRWGWRLRSAGVAVVVFVVVREVCWNVHLALAPKVMDYRLFMVCMAPLALISFAAALLTFHLSARRVAWLNGVPRCGRCGAETDAERGCAKCGGLVAAKPAAGVGAS
jgi:hypothetical protein